MNPILIDLGYLTIYWYSVFVFLGMLVGGFVLYKEAKRFNVSEAFISNLFFWTIPISLIGARIYYVLFNFSYYVNNPIDIIKIWEGGIAIHGGIIAGALFIIYYCKKYSISTGHIIDFVAPSIMIGQAIGRWGNFFNGEAHGGGTSAEYLKSLFVPDFIIEGMNINGYYYQPTFYYEFLWLLAGFILLLFIRRYKYLKVGHPTAFYLLWAGCGRLVIEAMRTDSLMFGSFKVAQVVSLTMIVLSIIIFIISIRGTRFENSYNDQENFRESN
jgi:phosphatidylglycerol:prolipoprotein diacylglycerol transferase